MVPRAQFQRINVAAARELLGAGGPEVFDVRDPASFARAHLDTARRLCEADLGSVLTSLPKDRPVLIYCYHGNASQVYAQTFVDFGFAEVYSMDGGFDAWRAAPAASGAGQP